MPRPRHLRRRSLVAVAACAAALAVPATAPAENGVQTFVNDNKGPLVLTHVLGGAIDVRYLRATVRERDGSTRVESWSGTSANRLIVLAGLDPAHVTALEVVRPDPSGGTVSLSTADILHGVGGSGMQALFDPSYNANTSFTTGTVRFFRPQGTSSDVNADDELDTPDDTDLVVRLTTDAPPITVSLRADPTVAQVDSQVHFSAIVAGAGAATTYTWDFGDGSPPTTTGASTIDHAYTTDHRSYDAMVTVLSHDGGAGADFARVQVGSTPGGDDGSGAPSSGAPSLSSGAGAGGGGGRQRVGGGHGAHTAPSSGPARGGVTKATGRHGGHGRTDAGRGAPAEPARSAASTQPVPPPPATGTSGGGAADAAHAATAPRHSTTPHGAGTGARAVQRASRADAGPSFTHVEGVVVASSGATAAALAGLQTPDARAKHDAATREAASASQPLSWWLLAIAALALLVGLGVARESGLHLTSRMRPS